MLLMSGIRLYRNKNLLDIDISFHGLGGYIKAAFFIWSAISSSSLNGKVPLTLNEYKTVR